MNKIFAYILSELILVHTAKGVYSKDCIKEENIICDCDNDVYEYCNISDGFRDIYISFDAKARQLQVVCPKQTKLNINFILETKFQSILRNSQYFEAKNCKDFKHEEYMNRKVRQILINMKELNELTLVYNSDFLAKPTEDFFGVRNLHHLQLIIKSSADVITVPTGIFSKLDKLETLTLRIQSLTKMSLTLQNLSQQYFQNITTLRQLDLSGNNMRILEANIFDTLAQLQSLNLSRNEILDLPRHLFANQCQLIILDLSYNLLTYLTPDLFTQTPLLYQLKLSDNRLHNITNLILNLKPLNYLHMLDLSQNQLQTIWDTASTLLTSFIHGNLSMNLALAEGLNYIRSIQPEKYAGNQLNSTVINLSGNRLREFNMDWLVEAGITCSFKINLEHNKIESIYALSNLLTTSADCEREIKMTGNRVLCDCKLAWICSENYRTFLRGLQCTQTSTKLLRDLAQLERNELCAWQPMLCPSDCVCYVQSELLRINCNSAQLDVIEQLPRPEQVGVAGSVLDISSNNFTVLPLNTTFGYANVSELHASYNKIANISLFQLPCNLTLLDLRNNRLKYLSAEFLSALLNDSSKLQSLYLSENPWFCDCAAQQLLYTVRAHRQRILDVEQLHCDNLQNVTLLTANVNDLCQTAVARYQNVIAIISTLALIIIILLFFFAIYYKYQLEVKVWLYGHNILSCCIHEYELDRNKRFDAFISYAHQEADFVNRILLPQLEQYEPPFRICTHERNWLAGAYIPEQIIESVEQSRRTIIVLSQHFIASDWARMEFRTAHQSSLNEGRARIIIIKYGELTNREVLDKELKAYLDMNTYLDWQDARFWDKLLYSMPHKIGIERSTDMLEVNGRMYVMGQVEMNRLHNESS